MTTATLGSISSGTLRTADLLDAFADALESIIDGEQGARADVGRFEQLISDARAWLEREQLESADSGGDHDGNGGDLVEELADALQEFAPPYCYFGAHEGDGADFGFWPDWGAIDEARAGRNPELESGDELPCACCFDGSDFLVVNDHGNATLYAKHTVVHQPESYTSMSAHNEWREVWSVV